MRKMFRIRGTTPEIEEAARRMRYSMTPAESMLWERLRSKRLDGFKFRAQHPVGRFILDFYCPSKRVAIELDGPIHETQSERDRARDQALEAHGYEALRIPNDRIFEELDSVLDEIRAVLMAR